MKTLAVMVLLLFSSPAWAFLDCTPGTVGSLNPACGGLAQSQSQAQTQNQTQSQTATGGSATATSSGGHTSGIAIAPSVFAPGLAAGGIVCLGSKSGGVSVGVVGVGAGFSLGSTVEDEKCNARADAATLASLGDADVGRARLCQIEAIAVAYATAGRPCATRPQAVSTLCPDGFPPGAGPTCAKSRQYEVRR